MLELLDLALAELPRLVAEPGWRGLRIDYHQPFVDRAWRPWREHRLSVHRIHPCAPGEALLHPHPWPSAIAILDGRYEMAVGYAAGNVAPPIAARMVLTAGARYEMLDPDGWHSVRPLHAPSLSIMLSGLPWARAMPVEPSRSQRELSADELSTLLAAVHGLRMQDPQ